MNTQLIKSEQVMEHCVQSSQCHVKQEPERQSQRVDGVSQLQQISHSPTADFYNVS